MSIIIDDEKIAGKKYKMKDQSFDIRELEMQYDATKSIKEPNSATKLNVRDSIDSLVHESADNSFSMVQLPDAKGSTGFDAHKVITAPIANESIFKD